MVALDFVFFSNSKSEAQELVDTLSESYNAKIVPADDPKYVLIKGTTRPYGNEFTKEQWLGWVDYMVSSGFNHNSVFSTWSVYEPKSKVTWSSEAIEIE